MSTAPAFRESTTSILADPRSCGRFPECWRRGHYSGTDGSSDSRLLAKRTRRHGNRLYARANVPPAHPAARIPCRRDALSASTGRPTNGRICSWRRLQSTAIHLNRRYHLVDGVHFRVVNCPARPRTTRCDRRVRHSHPGRQTPRRTLLGDRRPARRGDLHHDRLPHDVGSLVLGRLPQRRAVEGILVLLAALHLRHLPDPGGRLPDDLLPPHAGQGAARRAALSPLLLAGAAHLRPGDAHHYRRALRRRGLCGLRHPPPDRHLHCASSG